MVFPQTSVSIRFLEREAGALPKSSSFDAPPQLTTTFFCSPPPLGDLTHLPKKKSFWHLFLPAVFPPLHISVAAAGFYKRRKTKWFPHLFASSYQVPCIFCIILQKKRREYRNEIVRKNRKKWLQKRLFQKDLCLAKLLC